MIYNNKVVNATQSLQIMLSPDVPEFVPRGYHTQSDAPGRGDAHSAATTNERGRWTHHKPDIHAPQSTRHIQPATDTQAVCKKDVAENFPDNSAMKGRTRLNSPGQTEAKGRSRCDYNKPEPSEYPTRSNASHSTRSIGIESANWRDTKDSHNTCAEILSKEAHFNRQKEGNVDSKTESEKPQQGTPKKGKAKKYNYMSADVYFTGNMASSLSMKSGNEDGVSYRKILQRNQSDIVAWYSKQISLHSTAGKLPTTLDEQWPTLGGSGNPVTTASVWGSDREDNAARKTRQNEENVSSEYIASRKPHQNAWMDSSGKDDRKVGTWRDNCGMEGKTVPDKSRDDAAVRKKQQSTWFNSKESGDKKVPSNAIGKGKKKVPTDVWIAQNSKQAVCHDIVDGGRKISVSATGEGSESATAFTHEKKDTSAAVNEEENRRHRVSATSEEKDRQQSASGADDKRVESASDTSKRRETKESASTAAEDWAMTQGEKSDPFEWQVKVTRKKQAKAKEDTQQSGRSSSPRAERKKPLDGRNRGRGGVDRGRVGADRGRGGMERGRGGAADRGRNGSDRGWSSKERETARTERWKVGVDRGRGRANRAREGVDRGRDAGYPSTLTRESNFNVHGVTALTDKHDVPIVTKSSGSRAVSSNKYWREGEGSVSREKLSTVAKNNTSGDNSVRKNVIGNSVDIGRNKVARDTDARNKNARRGGWNSAVRDNAPGESDTKQSAQSVGKQLKWKAVHGDDTVPERREGHKVTSAPDNNKPQEPPDSKVAQRKLEAKQRKEEKMRKLEEKIKQSQRMQSRDSKVTFVTREFLERSLNPGANVSSHSYSRLGVSSSEEYPLLSGSHNITPGRAARRNIAASVSRQVVGERSLNSSEVCAVAGVVRGSDSNKDDTRYRYTTAAVRTENSGTISARSASSTDRPSPVSGDVPTREVDQPGSTNTEIKMSYSKTLQAPKKICPASPLPAAAKEAHMSAPSKLSPNLSLSPPKKVRTRDLIKFDLMNVPLQAKQSQKSRKKALINTYKDEVRRGTDLESYNAHYIIKHFPVLS